MPVPIPANLRALAKRPGFTLAAISIVALGIALATTVASVVDALIFRPIPVANIEALHRVNGNLFGGALPAPDVRDIIERTDAPAFSYGHRFSVEYALDKNAGLIVLCELQGQTFETLQWTPEKGRLLQPDDYLRGSEPVTVISHSFWQNELAARPSVIGESLLLNGKPFRVVGILKPQFHRLHRTIKPHAYTALVHTFEDWVYDRRGYYCQTMLARLDSPAALPAYQTQLDQAAAYIDDINAGERDNRSLAPLAETAAARENAAETAQQSFIIIGLVAALLLITCFNVGNMLLSNAYRREREFAIRRSVGAAPLQIVRQLFTESMAVSLLGGVLGIALSLWLVQLADDLPFAQYVDVRFNASTLAIAIAAILITALISGLLPAWHLARGNSADALKRGGKASRVNLSAKLLVVAQVALSSTLLCAAFLYTLSLKKSLDFDPGIDADQLAYFEASLQSVPQNRRRQVAQDLRAKLANIPGVETASFATSRPFREYGTSHINTDRFKSNEEEDHCASGYTYVSADYFKSLGVPILSGRDFREGEAVWPFEVALVNQAFERRFFPDSSAVDQTFKPWGGDEQPPVRIIGVFKDYPSEPWTEPRPLFALTQAQSRVTYHLRSTSDPRSILNTIETITRDPSNEFVAREVLFFTDAQKRSLRNERSALVVLGTLAVSALLLSSVGIWYTTRQFVRQSQKELSIRLALGAAPSNLLKLTLRRSLALIGTGLVLGIILSFVTARWIQSALQGVSATDPLPYLLMAATLFAVALLATYLPARNALKADPRDALTEV
ncbi:efflux ABC transporter, permease protein [Verrucomicrobiia bacterium DG1235]|nr:efflux ABC transporter, permease protein [Verrucomicrobiae bacterium DG1235]